MLYELAVARILVNSLLDLNICDWQAPHPRHKVDACFKEFSFLSVNWKEKSGRSISIALGIVDLNWIL